MGGYLRFDETVDSDDLQHYGVLGMKWGVRNAETRARYERAKTGFNVSQADYQQRLQKIGYSENQAKSIAKSREWYKKAAVGLLAVGAVAGVAAAGSFAVRRYGVKTLKAGQLIQTAHTGDIAERIGKQSFYASYTKPDNAIYKGFFGRTGGNVTKLAARQDIKIAPEAKAHKVFMETVKRNPLITYEEDGVKKAIKFDAYLIQQGINPDKASSIKTYRAFNHDLVHKSKPIYNAAHEAFYNDLKKHGYGALTDSYNAFGAHGYSYRPIIVFGDVKFDVAKQTVVKASSRSKSIAIAQLVSSTRPTAKNTAKLAAAGASAAALVGVEDNKTKARENYADKYRKEHPGTEKTDAEIKRMYDRSHFETDPYR